VIDWVAAGAIGTAGSALLAAGISWGVLRNRVATHAVRLDEGDKRMDRMEEAITSSQKIGNQVDLLAQRTDSGHALLKQQQEASDRLLSTKMDGVMGEVRSFMQGQASMGAKVSRPGPKEG
jgi:hypothetical protein